MAVLRMVGLAYGVIAALGLIAALYQADVFLGLAAAGAGVAAVLCFALDLGLTLLSEIRDSVKGESAAAATKAPAVHPISVGSFEGLEERLARSRNPQA